MSYIVKVVLLGCFCKLRDFCVSFHTENRTWYSVVEWRLRSPVRRRR